MRFHSYNDKWINTKIKTLLKIKSGQDQKAIQCDNGLYNIYGTGGIIGKTNKYLYNKESVGIGRKGTIDRPFYFSEPFWTVDTLFYSEIHNGIPKFIYYLFQTINWNLYNQSTGVPSLTSSVIENINVYIPNEKEQLEISNFLSIIDMRIETQKKIIEDYKALKNQIINSIYNTDVYNSKLSNLIIQISKRNKNNTIDNVLSVNNKYGFIKQSEQFEDREIASDDISNYKIISKDIFAYNPARINVGSIAKYNNEDEGIVSPMYICFKTNDALLPEYLNYYFDSNEFKYQMSKRLEGSVRQCLTFESLINIPFKLPSLEEQKKNADIISTFNNKILFEEKYLSVLELQKSYLLNKMFI